MSGSGGKVEIQELSVNWEKRPKIPVRVRFAARRCGRYDVGALKRLSQLGCSGTPQRMGLSEDDRLYFEERGRWLLKRLLFAYCGLPVAGVALGILNGSGEPLLWVTLQAIISIAFGMLFYRGIQLGRWFCIIMSALSAIGALSAASKLPPSEGALLLPFAVFYTAFSCVAAFSKSIRVFFNAQREKSINDVD